jgi:hypothetical protein
MHISQVQSGRGMFEDGLPNEEPDWLQQGDVVAYLTSSDIQHPWFSAYKKED